MGKEEGQSTLPGGEHACRPRRPWEALRPPPGGKVRKPAKWALGRGHAVAAQKDGDHKLS